MPYGYYVEIITPDCPVRREPLASGWTLVGRSPRSCGLVVDDARVSRVHLRIGYADDTGVTVMDMHSANGSALEGRDLFPGDSMHWLPDQVVSVGHTHLVLRYGSLDGQGE
ncbi:MAG: FHA domain-containing protein [Chloroflexi bacterium]|nr:FHA domain-containing protein [Chloroflexota bacterium]